jgi:hypothetical protein
MMKRRGSNEEENSLCYSLHMKQEPAHLRFSPGTSHNLKGANKTIRSKVWKLNDSITVYVFKKKRKNLWEGRDGWQLPQRQMRLRVRVI